MLDCLKCWYGVYYPYCPCKEDEERQSGETDKEEAQEMDSELFWGKVGDKVQSHFLYHTTLTKEQFKEICKEARHED